MFLFLAAFPNSNKNYTLVSIWILGEKVCLQRGFDLVIFARSDFLLGLWRNPTPEGHFLRCRKNIEKLGNKKRHLGKGLFGITNILFQQGQMIRQHDLFTGCTLSKMSVETV